MVARLSTRILPEQPGEIDRNEEVFLALEPHVAALASAAVETG